MLTQQRAKKIKSQKGATLVEFALVASVFFVILLAFLEFGFLFLQTHFVANAAREGVRIGIIANNYDCFDGGPGCQSIRADRVGLRVQNYLSNVYDEDVQVTVAGRTPSPPSPPDPNYRVKTILTVTVTAGNFMPRLLTGLMDLIGPATDPFVDQISYTAEGEYEIPQEDPDNCLDNPLGCTTTFPP